MVSSIVMLKLRRKQGNGAFYEPTQTVLLNQKYLLMSKLVLRVSVLFSLFCCAGCCVLYVGAWWGGVCLGRGGQI